MPILFSSLTSTTPRTTSTSTIPMIIKRCRKCSLPSVTTYVNSNGGFLQHKTRLPSAQLQLYYCCTRGTRHGHHGCVILVLTSSLSPVYLDVLMDYNYGCCPIQVRTMHTVTNHAHCCYARLFCPEGHPAGWSTSSSFGQADIHDHHLFDFQLVASDYTDCLLRYTSLSYISSQKAGHNTCHLQVHQQLTLTLTLSSDVRGPGIQKWLSLT